MESFSDNPDLRIRLHEVTSSDIYRFARSMFEKDVNFHHVRHIYLELVRDMVRQASGVFLWARLVVRSLLEGVGHRMSASALRGRLALVPRDLGQLFEQLLGAIDPADREQSAKTFLLANVSPWPSNSLTYTWLDDLDNPSFPFDAPICAYSDATIVNRQEAIRC